MRWADRIPFIPVLVLIPRVIHKSTFPFSVARNLVCSWPTWNRCKYLFLIFPGKTFDTVDHEILAGTLKYSWCSSAVDKKLPSLSLSILFSSIKLVLRCTPALNRCGVQQGSILGRWLFILFINDLQNASELIELLLFADGASIFHPRSKRNTLEFVLSNAVNNMEVWLRCNKLWVNVKKTTYLIFTPWQKKCNHNFLSPLVANF